MITTLCIRDPCLFFKVHCGNFLKLKYFGPKIKIEQLILVGEQYIRLGICTEKLENNQKDENTRFSYKEFSHKNFSDKITESTLIQHQKIDLIALGLRDSIKITIVKFSKEKSNFVVFQELPLFTNAKILAPHFNLLSSGNGYLIGAAMYARIVVWKMIDGKLVEVAENEFLDLEKKQKSFEEGFDAIKAENDVKNKMRRISEEIIEEDLPQKNFDINQNGSEEESSTAEQQSYFFTGARNLLQNVKKGTAEIYTSAKKKLKGSKNSPNEEEIETKKITSLFRIEQIYSLESSSSPELLIYNNNSEDGIELISAFYENKNDQNLSMTLLSSFDKVSILECKFFKDYRVFPQALDSEVILLVDSNFEFYWFCRNKEKKNFKRKYRKFSATVTRKNSNLDMNNEKVTFCRQLDGEAQKLLFCKIRGKNFLVKLSYVGNMGKEMDEEPAGNLVLDISRNLQFDFIEARESQLDSYPLSWCRASGLGRGYFSCSLGRLNYLWRDRNQFKEIILKEEVTGIIKSIDYN